MSEENNLLRRVFGMLQDNVRTYQIAEDQEVLRDEFSYCQVMYKILFGDKGFAETLGPTWRMIHDPRFVAIENMMVQERKPIFGGDARLGRQYFNDDGVMNSTVSDLEKYAELLGEGRNFHNALVHPDKNCQQRMWLERIYTGFTNLKPYEGFACTCDAYLDEHRLAVDDPTIFKDTPDEAVWSLIGQECPNRAVTRGGDKTAYGKLLYNLIRADLIGLIHDYAETPLIDSYVYLRDHGVVTATETVAFIDPHGQEAPRVLQEIDILEQALTHRATLRVTAYKILKKIGFEQKLGQLTGTDFFELTDTERDEMLRIVYESDYPEPDPKIGGGTIVVPKNWRPFSDRLREWEHAIEQKLLDYVRENCMGLDYPLRESAQLAVERQEAWRTVAGLLDGSIQPINSYTEPTGEIPADQSETEVMKYAAMMDAIMSNEFKQELYLLFVEAEKEGATAIIDILTPVFLTPGYPLDEQEFYRILERIRIGSKSLRAERMEAIRGTKQTTENPEGKVGLKETAGEFHSKDNPSGVYRGTRHSHNYIKISGKVQPRLVNTGSKSEHVAYFVGDARLHKPGDSPMEYNSIVPFDGKDVEVEGEFADGFFVVREIREA